MSSDPRDLNVCKILYNAGLTLVIEQAIGTCGESEARTERFRTSHQIKEGNVAFKLL